MAFDPDDFLAQPDESSGAPFDVNAFLGETKRQLKPSTVETLAKRENFGKQLQAESQSSTAHKIGQLVAAPVKFAWDLGAANVSAIPASLELLGQPERILPTIAEGARRAGMDVGQFIAHAVKSATQNPLQFTLPGALAKASHMLRPKTLTESEIQKAYEALPMQQAVASERSTLPEGSTAQPEVAEAIGQDIPLLLPAKGLKIPGLPGTNRLLVSKALETGGRMSTGFKATARDFVTSLYKPTTDQELLKVRKLAESGELLEPVQEILAIGKPKNAKQLELYAGKAKQSLGNEISKFLEGRAGDLTIQTDNVLEASLENIEKNPKLREPGMEKIKERLIEKAHANYGRERTARDLFNHQNYLNSSQKAAMSRDKVSRKTLLTNNPEKSMDDAARRAISKNLDAHISMMTGVEDNFFRGYGKLSELETAIIERINEASAARSAAATSGGTIRTGGLPGKMAAIGDMVSNLAGKVLPDDLSRLDSNVKKLFQRLPEAKAPRVLSDLERNILDDQRLAEQAKRHNREGINAHKKRKLEQAERKKALQEKFASKREALLKEYGASEAELAEGGAAEKTLSEMEKKFRSEMEAKDLDKMVEKAFPQAEKDVRKSAQADEPSVSAKDLFNNLSAEGNLRSKQSKQKIFDLYQDIQSKMKAIIDKGGISEMSTPEFQELWQQSENVKGLINGKTPMAP